MHSQGYYNIVLVLLCVCTELQNYRNIRNQNISIDKAYQKILKLYVANHQDSGCLPNIFYQSTL